MNRTSFYEGNRGGHHNTKPQTWRHAIWQHEWHNPTKTSKEEANSGAAGVNNSCSTSSTRRVTLVDLLISLSFSYEIVINTIL